MTVTTTRQALKPVTWVGRALDELRDMPPEAQAALGYQLHLVQSGETPAGSKPMGTTMSGGVRELLANTNRSWYRLMYTTSGDSVHVLHAFEKKANQTPQANIAIGLKRLRSVT